MCGTGCVLGQKETSKANTKNCMSSGRGLCDEPIPRPEESYLLFMCDTGCDLDQREPSKANTRNCMSSGRGFCDEPIPRPEEYYLGFIVALTVYIYIYIYIYIYTRCPRRNVPNSGRVFLMLKYTDITQNTYVQS